MGRKANLCPPKNSTWGMYTQMILWVPTTLALLLTSVVEKQLHSLVGR